MRQQAVDAAQQRGLAASRRADNGDDLALADVEVDIAEHFERAVILAEAAHADSRFVCFIHGHRCRLLLGQMLVCSSLA